MKNTKKILLTSLLAVAIVLMLGMMTSVFANDLDDAELISLSETKTCKLTDDKEEHYYKFIPTYTGYYTIKSSGNYGENGAFLAVYDEKGLEYEDNDTGLYHSTWIEDFDFSDGMHVCAGLKKGRTYYIEVSNYNLESSESRTVTTTISKHTHTLKSTKRAEGTFYGCEDSDGVQCSYEKFKITRKPVFTKFSRGKTNFTIRWKKPGSKSTQYYASRYQIQYSTSKKFKKSKKVTISTWTSRGYFASAKTIKKLKRHKKYYVRMRIYIKGHTDLGTTTYYGPWSKVKSVKTK